LCGCAQDEEGQEQLMQVPQLLTLLWHTLTDECRGSVAFEVAAGALVCTLVRAAIGVLTIGFHLGYLTFIGRSIGFLPIGGSKGVSIGYLTFKGVSIGFRQGP
jgi:hypothetical protein